MNLAIDRFVLPPHLERQAQQFAQELSGPVGDRNYALLLGYLSSSVAVALERPRWRNRDRLAIDLRVVELLKSRRASL